MKNKATILVVEEEPESQRLLSLVLNPQCYDIKAVPNKKEAIAAAFSLVPDLVLFNMSQQSPEEIAILDAIRDNLSCAIIVLFETDDDKFRVKALEEGADDVILKPFKSAELLARVKAVLRRCQRHEYRKDGKQLFGSLVIDLEKREVWQEEQYVHMTPIEFKILVLLSRHHGRVCTHDFIIREVWGPYVNEIESLRVNIANIRKKLNDSSEQPKYIFTQPGVGYRFGSTV
ncbi:MAG: response regulator transcription factor [Erysipelotrichaceae bacterium]|nr:response regulator transcription factor [Erysipelotrichaceae bacterium]